MPNTPEIKTKRLILRKFSEKDVDAYFKILSDPIVNKFLPWYPLKDLEQAKEDLYEKYLKTYLDAMGLDTPFVCNQTIFLLAMLT